MLSIEDHGSVRWLTLDGPHKNAIPTDQWSALSETFRSFEQSEQRVLVITGAGGEFCSGADLGTDDLSSGAVARYRGMKVVDEAAMALHRISKPTIAAVDGVAVGAGMNLALGCDLVVGTDRARFSEIFVRRGLTVDFGGTWILPRIVGLQRAKELALTGRIVGAEEAVRLGLMLEMVPPAQLHGRAGDLADELAGQSPLGQMFAKLGLNGSFGISLSEALALEAKAQAICLNSEDVIEGVSAFLQKRPPEFRGR